MKYILATDYDGTLRQGGEISKENRICIDKFRAEGHLFGVVSGRDFVYGYEQFKEKDGFPFDFVIMSGGATACDGNGNILFAKPIKNVPADRLVARSLELTGNPCGISFEKTRLDFRPGDNLDNIKNVTEFISSNVLCDTEEYAAQVCEILKNEFDGINPTQNGRCIDITAVGVGKASGIATLAQMMGVDEEKVWTAGDNYNDIDMLLKYHGCAMESGVDAAKKAAGCTCNAVADVIKMILNVRR